MGTLKSVIWASMIAVVWAGAAHANWSDSFDGGKFGLTTWKWYSYPQVKNTFTQTVQTTPDGNGYLVLKETTAASATALGAAFGTGFGTDEKFTDVRVAATVNVTGDASHNYHGLAARSTYIINDGKLVPGAAPGIVSSCYVMHINWENGPANLGINVEKVVNLSNIMRTDFDVVAPSLVNARSYYAALDVVGSGPVYVQASLYEFKGGPLVAQTAVMVDTNGNDAWEDPDSGGSNKVFTTGPSGIFAQNEHESPAGFYTTFDDIASVSDGPPAMLPGPANWRQRRIPPGNPALDRGQIRGGPAALVWHARQSATRRSGSSGRHVHDGPAWSPVRPINGALTSSAPRAPSPVTPGPSRRARP